MSEENKIIFQFTEEDMNKIVSSIVAAPASGYESIAKNKAIYTMAFKRFANVLAEKMVDVVADVNASTQSAQTQAEASRQAANDAENSRSVAAESAESANDAKKEVEAYAATIEERARSIAREEIAKYDFIKPVPELPEAGLPNHIYLVPKTESDTDNLFEMWLWVNKGTEEEPSYGWEFEGVKKVEFDLADYVKKTDYASKDKAGVFKTADYMGIMVNQDTGVIFISPAAKTNIDRRSGARLPISVETLDYAVKVGITTNTETLTDEEKASARAWVGAVGEKDWATDEIGGVLRSIASFGFQVDKYGRGQIVKAEKSDIDEATNEYKPIVSKMRDYFLMKALSDCKDTTLWTDDTTAEDGTVVKGTKTKALELLGAVKKVTNTQGQRVLYGVEPNGTEKQFTVSQNVSSNAMVQRRSDGSIFVPASTSYDNAAVSWYQTRNLPDYLRLTDDEKAKWSGMIGATRLYKHVIGTLELITTFDTPLTSNVSIVAGIHSAISAKIRSGNSRYFIFGAQIVTSDTEGERTKIIHSSPSAVNAGQPALQITAIDYTGVTDDVTVL